MQIERRAQQATDTERQGRRPHFYYAPTKRALRATLWESRIIVLTATPELKRMWGVRQQRSTTTAPEGPGGSAHPARA